jgi:glucose/arabinose dehydrogenase
MTTPTNTACRTGVARLIAASAGCAVLAACSSQLASTTPQQPGANPQMSGTAPAARPRGHEKSWMDPAARSHKLLYISDFGSADVEVFTYPYLRLAGVLTGFNEVRGECTDPSGYVWITDQAKGEVFEYAHGGTAPVNVLTAPDPIGCATSPTGGDLAVSNLSAGQIEIYPNAAGSGTVVADPNFARTSFLGYDKAGNLFVDGYDSSGNFHYAELPSGGSSFTDITLSQTPAGAGNVQWDGTYIAIGDTGGTIYQTQGSTVVSSTTLGTEGCVSQFYIVPSKHKVIAPDCEGNAGIYAYPAGGSPLQIISGGLLIPFGAVLSQ